MEWVDANGGCHRFVGRLCWIVASWVGVLLSVANGGERQWVSGDRLALGMESALSASVRVADIDNNGRPDVVVANGRHWPGQNYCFLNQGRARMNVQIKLGSHLSTSYSAEPADLDGDGDLDIAVGNDMAPNRIFLNDGAGRFEPGNTFGQIASVRSLTVVDIDRDGDQDILATCRGMPNQIYLNAGDATFAEGLPFGTKQDSTIDVAVADWNGDSHLDLVLANRDDQQNTILINDGDLGFNTVLPFGQPSQQSRAVSVADLNGDTHPDIVVANIGQANRIYFGDGTGSIIESVEFGNTNERSYSLAVADLDNDRRPDLVIGNVGQSNAVFFNRGDGRTFAESRFGDPSHATYGIATGDFDGDGFRDLVTANSGARNFLFLNRPSRPTEVAARRSTDGTASAKAPQGKREAATPTNSDWSAFRGSEGRGVADQFPVRTTWDARDTETTGVLWKVPVPGLGHSSPVIVGERLFLATAIASDGEAPLKVGRGGQPDAADDQGEQSWVVLCYDRTTGRELWRRTARRGEPRATRHAKATHANTTVAVDGDRLVAFFGSEGIYCYDLNGNLIWSRDLGLIDISKYGIGWGFASSPAIHQGRIAIVCDDPNKPYVALLRLTDGEEVWRTDRTGISERNWSTPLIHSTPRRTQVVVNGWPWIVSYDFATGETLWKIHGGGDNPVPTPFATDDGIYITSSHGAESPIFLVRPDGSGDITPPEESGANDAVVWSTRRGGSYMSTPVVYNDYLYLGNTNGTVRCFHAQTGEKIYEKRLDSGASIIASLVAGDGKVFCASENGNVYVLKAGSEFEVLAKNPMGDPCFASPAIVKGVLYIRTTKHLVAIE